MSASMVLIMLLFMLNMYTRRLGDWAILVISVAGFAVALWLVRSQETVEDVS